MALQDRDYMRRPSGRSSLLGQFFGDFLGLRSSGVKQMALLILGLAAAALLFRACDGLSNKPRGTNVNTATVKELGNLPGVSKSVAAAIYSGRPYTNVAELIRVRGIGPKTLERVRPFVRTE
jgi:transcriptional accessory protein Tex/SPT6